MNTNELPYRANVAALIWNGKDAFLAGERTDIPGAWQVPQGGIEPNESEEEALLRELREELGLSALRILARSSSRYCYDFPPELVSQRDITRRYRGQCQRFFLVVLPTPVLPDPADGDGEFRAFAWRTSEQLLNAAAPFKRQALKAALDDLAPFFCSRV